MKFGTEDSNVMPKNVYEFHLSSVQWKPYLTEGLKWNFSLFYTFFLLIYLKFSTCNVLKLYWLRVCRGNVLRETPTSIMCIREFLFFHSQCPMWVKFVMKDLNTLMLSVCEFCENQDKIGHNRKTVWCLGNSEHLHEICPLYHGAAYTGVFLLLFISVCWCHYFT